MAEKKVTEQLPANIAGKFNLALTQAGFQAMANKEATLVYNRDNLAEIKGFIESAKAIEKVVEQIHKDGKAEALQIGRNWDAAKNMFLAQVGGLSQKPKTEYEKLCREIEEERRLQEIEANRVKGILAGIENNAVMFANLIAGADSTEKLISVERQINLEKTRKEKYQEFLDDAVSRFSQLNAILAEQKQNVKELEALKLKELEALETDNSEEVNKIQEAADAKREEIEQAKVNVQETAISQTAATNIIVPQQVYPTVKPSRTTWEYEVVDINETQKKMPGWVVVSPNNETIKQYLNAKKAEGIKDDFTVAGIRFYKKVSY